MSTMATPSSAFCSCSSSASAGERLATLAPENGERERMVISSRGVDGAVRNATLALNSWPSRNRMSCRGAAERLGGEAIIEGVDVIDRLVVDRNNDVAGLETGLRGRAARRHVGDQRTGRPLELHAVGNVGGELLQLGAEPGPQHGVAAAFGGGHHHPHHVGGNGEADALRAARAREDRGVDADQPAGHIDQRAARITRVDRSIGLDEELIVGDADLRARQSRDDAVRHGLTDAERIADGEHDVAHLERVGIGEIQHRKLLVRVLEAQHGEIAALVLEHDFGLEFALVGERHLDLVGALDHVHVGDHEAGRVDDHAGAQRALDLRGRRRPARRRSGGRSGRRTAGCGSAPPWRRRR